MEQFYTDYKHYKIELISNHIIYVKFLDRGAGEIDLEIMKEMIDVEYKLIKKEPFYQIIDLRNMFINISVDAKEYTANNEEFNKLRISEAFLINSLPNKIVFNSYISFHKPTTPTKAFTIIEEALDWLKSKGCPEEDLDLANCFLAKL